MAVSTIVSSRWLNWDFTTLWHHKELIFRLAQREVFSRYRTSALGMAWNLILPMMMLSVYTLIFGVVFKPKVAVEQPGTSSFDTALHIYAGLIVFSVFSEVIGRSPTLMLENISYIKKVVFPLEILPLVSLLSSLTNFAFSLIVFMIMHLMIKGYFPIGVVLVPLILLPYALLLLGFCWFLSSLGVFVRDISQIMPPLITALMFCSPIFFSVAAFPADWQWIVWLNPLSVPIELIKDLLLKGSFSHFEAFAAYSLVALAVCELGWSWFQKTKKAFSDVV